MLPANQACRGSWGDLQRWHRGPSDAPYRCLPFFAALEQQLPLTVADSLSPARPLSSSVSWPRAGNVENHMNDAFVWKTCTRSCLGIRFWGWGYRFKSPESLHIINNCYINRMTKWYPWPRTSIYLPPYHWQGQAGAFSQCLAADGKRHLNTMGNRETLGSLTAQLGRTCRLHTHRAEASFKPLILPAWLTCITPWTTIHMHLYTVPCKTHVDIRTYGN